MAFNFLYDYFSGGGILACRIYLGQCFKPKHVELKILPILTGIGLALPFSLGAFGTAITDLRWPSQTFDAMFHYSAIRWILETGDASSLNLAAVATNYSLQEATKGGFYPAGFHSLVALSVTDDIVTATNVVVIVVCSILWPFTVGALATSLRPKSNTFPVFTILAATTFSSFPEQIVSYGVLYPSALAFTLLPLAAITLADLSGRNEVIPFNLRSYCSTVLAVIAVSLTHPSAFFAMFCIALVLLIDLGCRLAWKTIALTKQQIMFLTYSILATSIGVFLILQTQTIQNLMKWKREGRTNIFNASAALIFEPQGRWMGHDFIYFEWFLGAVTLLGIGISLKTPKMRWWVCLWAISAYAFVASAVVNLPFYDFLAPWYYDPPRLRALVVIFAAPLAGVGVQYIFCKLIHLKSISFSKTQRKVALIVVVVGLFFGFNKFGYPGSVARLEANYTPANSTDSNVLATASELDFIKTLPQYINKGEMIVGDPRSGLPLIYALTGLNVAYRHIDGNWSEDFQWIAKNFNGVLSGESTVCKLLKKHNIKYFYADSKLYWPDGPMNTYYRGLTHVNHNPEKMKMLAQKETAALYEISTCNL